MRIEKISYKGKPVVRKAVLECIDKFRRKPYKKYWFFNNCITLYGRWGPGKLGGTTTVISQSLDSKTLPLLAIPFTQL